MAKKKLTKISGSYILIIQVLKDTSIEIGRLGFINFLKGYYAYIGSALNNQLLNRVYRHVKPASEKKLHWHIDYFLAHENTSVKKIFLTSSSYREECELAEVFRLIATKSIENFGSSDCKCSSHLFFYGKNVF
jgi:Uri superfamily endonuclease